MGHGASTFFKGVGGGLEEAGDGIKKGFDDLGDTPFFQTVGEALKPVEKGLQTFGGDVGEIFEGASGTTVGGDDPSGGAGTPGYGKNSVAPKVNPYIMPQNFADRQSTLQRGTANPASTSHNSTARFGVASHV